MDRLRPIPTLNLCGAVKGSNIRRLILITAAGSLLGCIRTEFRNRDSGPDATGMDAGVDDAQVMLNAEATRAVLDSIGTRVVAPLLVQFESDARALVGATEANAAGPTTETRDAARAAWRQAIGTWQHLEMIQVGPAGLSTNTVLGRGLRDEIFAWPLVSRCRIDQVTASDAYADSVALLAQPLNVRGLAAMEYLLFYDAADNGCAATAVINTSGAWAALGDAEVLRRRAVYAHTLAVLIEARATELRAAWDPAGENFIGALRTAGAGSAAFPTAQAGLNAVSDALFYLYKEVADNKLGIPAGVRMECTSDLCPDRVESIWAHASLDHIRSNLETFQAAYLGGPPDVTDASGFDDLLRSIGASMLDDEIQTGLTGCFTALDAVEGPLESALTLDHADVIALHDAIRAVGVLFKVQVLTLLDLELPRRLDGDAD